MPETTDRPEDATRTHEKRTRCVVRVDPRSSERERPDGRGRTSVDRTISNKRVGYFPALSSHVTDRVSARGAGRDAGTSRMTARRHLASTLTDVLREIDQVRVGPTPSPRSAVGSSSILAARGTSPSMARRHAPFEARRHRPTRLSPRAWRRGRHLAYLVTRPAFPVSRHPHSATPRDPRSQSSHHRAPCV